MSTNKTFNKVQLDVKFTQATSRTNLTSEENISISFGKLSKWYGSLVPTGGSSGQFLGWNSDGTAKWVSNPNTDTKVTSSANHYTPATASGQDKSASASGATAAWSIDVVKGVTLNTDGKGHVTGLSVTSGKIPGNPVPSNNVTGSGTSGYLTKWNGTNTITNGPQLGSSTTTFLRNDGSWATPAGTTYSAGAHLSLSSTTFSLASYCKSITDWNNATTNGWYMGSSVTNAPSTEWWMGRVIAHNNKYCIQEVWNFSVSAPDNANPDAMYMSHKKRWFRAEHWGPWVDVSTPTPSAKVNCEFGTVASRTTNVTRGWMAHWDGSYNGSSSNLTYCNRGAFGTIVTKNAGDYALSNHTHNSLYGVSSTSAVPVTTLADGQLKVFYNVNSGLSGNMPASNNANAIIQINKHHGNYDSQLGFSSNGNIYYRSCNGTALSASVPWKRIYDTSDPPTASEVGALASTTKYAGSSSVGGAATSANKLNTNAGATNRPVYFSGGVPVQCDTPALGSWFKGVPLITADGVMEVGRYFDMHSTNTGTTDYDVRLDASGVSSFRFTFNTPTSSSIAPSTNNQTSLGTSSLKWSNVYATTFYGALSGNASTATRANYINVVAGNEIRFYNDNQFTANKHFWLGYSWADGSHYTPSGGSDTSSTTAPNITKFIMGNCSQGGLASVHAKTFILGNGSSPTHISKTTTITTAATTTDRTITLPDASGTIAVFPAARTSGQVVVTDGTAGGVKSSGYTIATSVPSGAVFTDSKVTQTAVGSTYTNYRPIVISSANSATKGFSPSTTTDGTFITSSLYCQPSSGMLHANIFEAGKPKTADGAAKGQLKFFSGNSSDATGTVTLECVNDAARTGDYTVKLPTWNGTIPIFEKLFEGASNTVSLSYSDINEYDVFLITVANSNATSEQVTVTSLWISNVAGIHDMPLIWGGAPTSSGGSCNVTSGWIQLSKNSGTTTFVVAHKPSVAQMTSSGWTISSPTYNLYIRKIFGLKAFKRT